MDAGRDTPGKKAAIVTAAGKGMGAACARELAARGYSVALMSRSPGAAENEESLAPVNGKWAAPPDVARLAAEADKVLPF